MKMIQRNTLRRRFGPGGILLALSILASLACASADAASPAASPPPPPHLWSGLIYATNPSHPAPAPGDEWRDGE